MHVRTWSFYAFILVFQLSGGIYLSALPDMEGETALMQEDLLVAGCPPSWASPWPSPSSSG